MTRPGEVQTLPAKTREVFSIFMDSTRWNGFRFRDDDIVIATYAKAGTTWMQQIVAQLVFQGSERVDVPALSPWLEMRLEPPEKIASLDLQTHRRFLKTHLPVDALVFSTKARYVYVARDGRDVAWSAYNHFARATPLFYDAFNSLPGREGPPLAPPDGSAREFFRSWLDHDGAPMWPFWDHVRGWWAIRDLPNVWLVHFETLKRDLAGSIRELADFLGIRIEASRFPDIVRHCGFDWMKANAGVFGPPDLWDGGMTTFIHKGTNGRWRDALTPEDCAAYEARALAELGPDCARWLATGER